MSKLMNGGKTKKDPKIMKNFDRALQSVKRDLGWSSDEENENKQKTLSELLNETNNNAVTTEEKLEVVDILLRCKLSIS